MLIIFPIVFAVVYMTSVAGILYAGLICQEARGQDDDEHDDDGSLDSEFED
jgi:hypothetical protein